MRWIAQVQTRDGQLHADAKAAERHAEKVYGEALSKVVASLVHIEKYTALHEFIDANLERFAELRELKADIGMTNTQEDI